MSAEFSHSPAWFSNWESPAPLIWQIDSLAKLTPSPTLYKSLIASTAEPVLLHRANGKGAIGANDLEIDATP
ncbi:hypothetical protein MRX96_024671 [Rhipicephalus microplus]